VQTLAQIKQMLEERGLRPRHALGQNFLIDKNLIGKLVDASAVRAGDCVLEVGPGTGALTEALLERGAHVVACELDRGLAELLRDRVPTLGLPGTFTLVEGDCLAGGAGGKRLSDEAARALAGRPFSLVANLPYGAATPLMLNLLIDFPACARQGVTIQREVAQRLAAQPGSKDYGTLSVVAQAMATVEIIAKLPPECFWPRPEITSAMVLLTRREQPATAHPARLALLCQRLFSQRRKQLGGVLGRETALPPGVQPTQRAEELSVEQLVWLAERVTMAPGEDAPEVS
jgi:16S rRNA (adenine1518-N6/adenine1519-N6)-dimethyltransferase